jgi:hypothetical protein
MAVDEGGNRMIEQVLIKKTLKAGETIWAEGSIIDSPLPEVLLDEIRFETGSVEVLKRDDSQPSEKLTFVAQRVDEENTVTSTTSQIQTETGVVALKKPEAQLKEPQRPRHRPKKTKLVRRKK